MTLKEWLDFNEPLLCGSWVHLHVANEEGKSLMFGAFLVPVASVLCGRFEVVAITGEIVQKDTHLVSLALVKPSEKAGDRE